MASQAAPDDRLVNPFESIANFPVILHVTRIRESVAQDDTLFVGSGVIRIMKRIPVSGR